MATVARANVLDNDEGDYVTPNPAVAVLEGAAGLIEESGWDFRRVTAALIQVSSTLSCALGALGVLHRSLGEPAGVGEWARRPERTKIQVIAALHRAAEGSQCEATR